MIDPFNKGTPAGGFGFRASACGCKDGFHGLRKASGGKDIALGFIPLAAVGGGRIAEGDFSLRISFWDFVGTLLGVVRE